jgi:N-acetyl-gamma-glutamyl-phosphate reductase
VAIVGARGYAGLELARVLLRHPGAKLVACYSADADFRLSHVLPDERGAAQVPTLPMEELGSSTLGPITVFLATPAEVSMKLAPGLLKAGCHVIDLSGAFRLEAKSYKGSYGFEHECSELLAQAHYGLVPWAGASSGSGAKLIANPGCYATAVLMALLPLLKEGLVDPVSVVIDAKSGTSGAGRKASEGMLFTEVAEDCLPYKVGRHQHLPEITRFASQWGGKAGVMLDPWFTTHLLSVRRGITAGIYARLAPGVTLAQVADAYGKAYAGYPLLKHGVMADGPAHSLASLKRVTGTPRTQISYNVSGEKLYVFSLIDNLLKGAATQAVENFNCLWDYPVPLGLLEMEVVE